jgi:Protein of unknown function (DUF732)
MMRFAAWFAVPLTGLAFILCPPAQADPSRTPEDSIYFKWLQEVYLVNYQGRVTDDEMMAKAHMVCDALAQNPTKATLVSARDAIVKQGVLTQDEATKVAYSAVSTGSYCPQFGDLKPIP